MSNSPIIHIEIHLPNAIPPLPRGEIVMIEEGESRYLVLKSSSDQGRNGTFDIASTGRNFPGKTNS